LNSYWLLFHGIWRMKRQVFYMILSFFVLTSFIPAKEMNCRRSGISGHVYLEKGNRMPSPGAPLSPPIGIKTKLYIYELTNISQVDRASQAAFYRNVPTRLVKETESGEDGSFRVKLKPGVYSLFVKKGELFFSNIFDEKNNIFPVTVKRGTMEDVIFRVNDEAVY
jgi:hypothetical protein